MTATINTDAAQTGWLKIDIAGNATAGGVNSLGSVYNPEGVLLQILDVYLYTTVASAAAATLDIGIGATGADSTDMCAALAINAAAPNVKRICGGNVASGSALTAGQNGTLWTATTYMNFYNPAAQLSTAFRAALFVEYLRLA